MLYCYIIHESFSNLTNPDYFEIGNLKGEKQSIVWPAGGLAGGGPFIYPSPPQYTSKTHIIPPSIQHNRNEEKKGDIC